MIGRVLKGVGWFLVVVMALWLATTNTAPNTVVDRMILGFIMIATGYVIEIRDILKGH